MKRHTALEAWLPTARGVQISELLNVVAPYDGVTGATTWRFATGRDVVFDSATWSANALLWERSGLTFKAGVEMGSCTITLHPRAGDVLGGLPVASAIRAGLWDAATFTLLRAYFDDAGGLRGVLPRYVGSLGPVNMVNGDVELTLRPQSETMNRSVPPVYQASCLNTVFDVGCGLNRAAWEVAGAITAGSSRRVVTTSQTIGAGYFTAGVLLMTSGPLQGLRRTVREHRADGSLVLFDDLPSAPTAGVGYRLSPGCDRTLGAGGCAKFNNRVMFRGQPFIPQPETAL